MHLPTHRVTPILSAALVTVLSACANGGGTTTHRTGGEPGSELVSPSGTRLRVTRPTAGAVLGSSVVEVEGTTNAESVTIDGSVVEVVDGRFVGVVELGEGGNLIVVQAEDLEESIPVTVDSLAPVVEILSPAPGSFVEGNVIEVVGRAVDDDLRRIEVDGQAVAFQEDGSFVWRRVIVPGARRVRVVATDAAGHAGYAATNALVGDFLRPGELAPQAAALHVGSRALDVLGEGVQPYLTSSFVRPRILAQNPVVSGFWGRLDATSERHGAATVSVTPGSGRLVVTVRIEDIRIPVRADLSVGPDITGTAYADAAVAEVAASVGVSGGRPVVTITYTDVDIEGLLVDIDGLWSWADRNLVTAAVRGTVESSLEGLVARYVPPAVESAVERIPTSYGFSVMDEPAFVSGAFESLRVTSGGLSARLAMGVEALDPDPQLAARAPGSLLLDVGAPPTGAERDVRAAMSLDLVNAGLFAGWSTGAVAVDLNQPLVEGTPLSVGVLSLLAPRLRDLAPAAAPVSVHIAPALPPVVQPAEDGSIEVVLPDVRVTATAEVDGATVELFELSVGITAPVRVSAAGNAISLALGDLQITADAVGADAPIPPGHELDELIAGLVGPLPEDQTSVDGLVLPQLFGFSVTDYAADLEDGYLTFRGRLRR